MAAELPKVVKPAPMDMGRVKARYPSELVDIAGQYDQGKLDVRGAYQRMSRCIRGFVHAATGIRVQNYTLYDIERLNMPGYTILWLSIMRRNLQESPMVM